jgi:hypothetical protein
MVWISRDGGVPERVNVHPLSVLCPDHQSDPISVDDRIRPIRSALVKFRLR